MGKWCKIFLKADINKYKMRALRSHFLLYIYLEYICE